MQAVQVVLSGLAVTGLSVALALGGLHLVRRKFPDSARRANKEVAGFFLAVLGVVYAVLLAFVVVTVWERFDRTQAAADGEANQLVVVYRLALALPDPVGPRLRDVAGEYAAAMIEEEWPAMARGQLGPRTGRLNDELWATVTNFEPSTERDRLLQAQTLDRLHEMDDDRRLRQLASQSGLPGVLWGLLIDGAIVTVAFTYFFSSPSPRAQYVMTALYTASIVFVLLLIQVLNFPFRGALTVTPEAFVLALRTFARLSQP